MDTLENTLTDKVNTMENKMDQLLRRLDSEPFNPANSVIIFGLPHTKDEIVKDKVKELFSDTLEVGVNIIHAERASPRDNKPGAVKVELEDTWAKLTVLRAKQKCNLKPATSKIRIRGCENHSDRVNRQNSSFILKLLGKDKECMVVANGLIKTKDEIKSFVEKKKANAPIPEKNNSDGSEIDDNSSDEEEVDVNDDAANDNYTTPAGTPSASPARPHGQMGDNTKKSRAEQIKTNTNTSDPKTTNQSTAVRRLRE